MIGYNDQVVRPEGGSVAEWCAEGPGFKSQSQRYRVTVLGKLLKPMCPCPPSSKTGSSRGNCSPGGK